MKQKTGHRGFCYHRGDFLRRDRSHCLFQAETELRTSWGRAAQASGEADELSPVAGQLFASSDGIRKMQLNDGGSLEQGSEARFDAKHLGLALLVTLVSFLPLALGALGMDFGAESSPSDEGFALFQGSFVHTLLEWSATATAAFTTLLAFTHFYIKRDVVTPVIGVALLSAGTVDAFHTLAADRMIEATADNARFIPFTWAISRTFNAVIPVSALAMAFFAQRYQRGSAQRRSWYVVLAVSVLLGGLAYGLIHYCATSSELPQTMFPNQMISRPWDVYPLSIYFISGFVIYPLFSRRIGSHFSFALWLSVLPDLMTQVHMAFGSAALFDHHFNVAHFLKIVAYLVPCMGLILDYVETYQSTSKLKDDAEERLQTLTFAKQDLEQVAEILSCSLHRPVRDIHSLSASLLASARFSSDADHEITRSIHENAGDAQNMMEDLVGYLNVRCELGPKAKVDLNHVLENAISRLKPQLSQARAEVEEVSLPEVAGDEQRLNQLFEELIGNSLKFAPGGGLKISITTEPESKLHYRFGVHDNGLGLSSKTEDKVFRLFFRKQMGSSSEGRGTGLAMAQKIVRQHGGKMWVESQPGEGASFYFTLPRIVER